MTRDDIHEKFKDIDKLAKRFPLVSIADLHGFLKGERDLPCTAWGNPTYNVKGWKGPCYLITDAHYNTFEDLMTKTPWENYGAGNDPRCEHCMVHCGYEPSAALRNQRQAQRSVQDAELAAELSVDGTAVVAATGEVKPTLWSPAPRDSSAGMWRGSCSSAGHGAGPGARSGEQLRELDGSRPCQGDLRDPESLERAVEGCGVVFHVAADYRLWAPRSGGDVPLECRRHAQSAGSGATRRRRARRLYQHGGLHRHAARRASGDETTPVQLEDMTGPYKRSKFLAEQVALEFARDGLPGGDCEPDRAGGRSRFQADADGQDRGGFRARRDAGVSRYRA